MMGRESWEQFSPLPPFLPTCFLQVKFIVSGDAAVFLLVDSMISMNIIIFEILSLWFCDQHCCSSTRGIQLSECTLLMHFRGGGKEGRKGGGGEEEGRRGGEGEEGRRRGGGEEEGRRDGILASAYFDTTIHLVITFPPPLSTLFLYPAQIPFI